MELAELLKQLTSVFGGTSAVAIAAWWYERRANLELQRRLFKLATIQIQAATEIRVALEAIKETVKNDTSRGRTNPDDTR